MKPMIQDTWKVLVSENIKEQTIVQLGPRFWQNSRTLKGIWTTTHQAPTNAAKKLEAWAKEHPPVPPNPLWALRFNFYLKPILAKYLFPRITKQVSIVYLHPNDKQTVFTFPVVGQNCFCPPSVGASQIFTLIKKDVLICFNFLD